MFAQTRAIFHSDAPAPHRQNKKPFLYPLRRRILGQAWTRFTALESPPPAWSDGDETIKVRVCLKMLGKARGNLFPFFFSDSSFLVRLRQRIRSFPQYRGFLCNATDAYNLFFCFLGHVHTHTFASSQVTILCTLSRYGKEGRTFIRFSRPLPSRKLRTLKLGRAFPGLDITCKKSAVFPSRSPEATAAASIKLSYGSTNFRLLFLHDAMTIRKKLHCRNSTSRCNRDTWSFGHFALDRRFSYYSLGGPHSSTHAKTLNLPRGPTVRDFPLAPLPSFSLSLLQSAIPLYPSLFFLQFFPRYEVLPLCTGRDTAKP